MDLLMSSSPLFSLTHSIEPRRSLAAKSIIAIVNSLTAFALAPGVLKTTTPSSANLSKGILLTPAPALATHKTLFGNSISCIAALLTITASALSILSVDTSYSLGNTFNPIGDILFKQKTFIICVPLQILSCSSLKLEHLRLA